ncbi:flagellar basal body P-ring formation chaperone FlgA [Sphingomonas abietis]|uniref:Flagella basal body P-ring formation protein FlgA n=1 Tax=Sphingomonas abietis TaxID=3012344 RepID=A0ABY7NKV6_9SPHN|nr:flagellar basal body P-ring formation chaperone FlgA [Sphingomonas abietis]WBO22129.1 flagellar basal body P-ring formation chaperone FlgA [Sphingomonas abietis]
MTRKGLALILLLAGSPAYAATDASGFEDLTKLEGRVVGALDADVGKPGGPVTHLDHRLKLQPCPQPVAIDPPALGAVALRCESIGWRIRVPLVKAPGMNAVANSAAVGPALYQSAQPTTPPLIKRGDPVQLVSGDNGFTVTTSAVAQEDGRLGGRIRVKASDRNQIMIGMVEDGGSVRMSSF